MQIVNISEAKAQLSSLVAKVCRGQEILIARAGTPVARLVPFQRSDIERRPGALRGKIHMAEDFDVLPADIAEAFGVEGG